MEIILPESLYSTDHLKCGKFNYSFKENNGFIGLGVYFSLSTKNYNKLKNPHANGMRVFLYCKNTIKVILCTAQQLIDLQVQKLPQHLL